MSHCCIWTKRISPVLNVFSAGLSPLHVFPPRPRILFSLLLPPFALWIPFSFALTPPPPLLYGLNVLISSWSAVNNVLPPTPLTLTPPSADFKPPPLCDLWSFPPPLLTSRQGGLREQLHHGGQQVGGAEHGGGGGGMHVQVPHHPLRLHHTRAAQPREPGEWWREVIRPSAHRSACVWFSHSDSATPLEFSRTLLSRRVGCGG